MARNRSCGGGKFVSGILFGSLLGGITALLFAPKSGVKLRKDLNKKYDEVSEKCCDLMDGVCEQTCDLVDKAKEIACNAKEAATKISKRYRD